MARGMKLLIFGGTVEGRVLAQRLTDMGHEVTVSVATPLGVEELRGIPCKVAAGRLNVPEMEKLAQGYEMIIDATHPYAKEVSANIRTVCRLLGLPLRRVVRDSSEDAENGKTEIENAAGQEMIHTKSCAEAASYLLDKSGNVMVATGTKELRAFSGISPERLFPRVLPTHEAISTCEELHIPHRNILALQGPFTLEMNTAMLRQYNIRHMVTKDGGPAGGFPEKKEAALRAGVCLVIVDRPADSGIRMEELIKELEGRGI